MGETDQLGTLIEVSSHMGSTGLVASTIFWLPSDSKELCDARKSSQNSMQRSKNLPFLGENELQTKPERHKLHHRTGGDFVNEPVSTVIKRRRREEEKRRKRRRRINRSNTSSREV